MNNVIRTRIGILRVFITTRQNLDAKRVRTLFFHSVPHLLCAESRKIFYESYSLVTLKSRVLLCGLFHSSF